MATHSSVLAWRIPGMAGPSGLPSMGSHRVGHDCSDLAAAAAAAVCFYLLFRFFTKCMMCLKEKHQDSETYHLINCITLL